MTSLSPILVPNILHGLLLWFLNYGIGPPPKRGEKVGISGFFQHISRSTVFYSDFLKKALQKGPK
jgi:hypothetical protein